MPGAGLTQIPSLLKRLFFGSLEAFHPQKLLVHFHEHDAEEGIHRNGGDHGTDPTHGAGHQNHQKYLERVDVNAGGENFRLKHVVVDQLRRDENDDQPDELGLDHLRKTRVDVVGQHDENPERGPDPRSQIGHQVGQARKNGDDQRVLDAHDTQSDVHHHGHRHDLDEQSHEVPAQRNASVAHDVDGALLTCAGYERQYRSGHNLAFAQKKEGDERHRKQGDEKPAECAGDGVEQCGYQRDIQLIECPAEEFRSIEMIVFRIESHQEGIQSLDEGGDGALDLFRIKSRQHRGFRNDEGNEQPPQQSEDRENHQKRQPGLQAVRQPSALDFYRVEGVDQRTADERYHHRDEDVHQNGARLVEQPPRYEQQPEDEQQFEYPGDHESRFFFGADITKKVNYG